MANQPRRDRITVISNEDPISKVGMYMFVCGGFRTVSQCIVCGYASQFALDDDARSPDVFLVDI